MKVPLYFIKSIKLLSSNTKPIRFTGCCALRVHSNTLMQFIKTQSLNLEFQSETKESSVVT